MKAAVVLFPGSNREGDAARALRQASGRRPDRLARRSRTAAGNRSGRAARRLFLWRLSALRGDRRARADHGRGARPRRARRLCARHLQRLPDSGARAGCLPGVLMRNRDLRFVCKMQHLRVERADTVFTRSYSKHQAIKVAIAHGEGNYEAHEETIRALEAEGRVAFRYCDASGVVGGAANPNGSTNDIAGIYSENLRVLGMMPHPGKPDRPAGRRRRRARDVRIAREIRPRRLKQSWPRETPSIIAAAPFPARFLFGVACDHKKEKPGASRASPIRSEQLSADLSTWRQPPTDRRSDRSDQRR
jgi:phosphoribosylformylglycinamidine (FGAM) synthase-like amidotransferase family enzyme